MKLSPHCLLGGKLTAFLAVQTCVLQFFLATAIEFLHGAKGLNVAKVLKTFEAGLEWASFDSLQQYFPTCLRHGLFSGQYQGRIQRARGPRPSQFLGPHAGVTHLVACLKIVKVCPSSMYYPLKILFFVVPTLVLRLP